MTKSIIIAERDNVAAVTENGKVTDFFVNKGEVFLNDIYLSTVDNILPGIEAAFVDIGFDKMGFLHANDVPGKGNLKSKLSPKQKLMVQVVKEPTGHKGPRVTTEISLPGRFLVLIPEETGINVSRKITSAKERARLKSVVSLVKPVGIGVIVRTEAEGQDENDIREDMELLLEKWNTVISAAETREAPSLLFRDQDLLYRVIREACTEDISEIIVDTPFALQRTQQILQNWNMNKNIALSVHKGNEPLLVSSGIVREIKAALQTKVMLPSGGYLFIQTTEALTVVDVNSGKFISSATQDETIRKTNIEAVHEIARQLRLRNIGGMVIVDFIDMNNRNDKLSVMEEFELALENDKAKPQIGQLSDLGLVELTRHRQGQALSEVFAKKCPHCGGSGILFEEIKYAGTENDVKSKPAKLKASAPRLKNINNNKPEDAENGENTEENGQNNQNNNNRFNKQNNRFNKKNKFNNKFRNNEKEEPKPDTAETTIPEAPVVADEKNENPAKIEETVKAPEKQPEQTVEQSVKTEQTAQTPEPENREVKEAETEDTKPANEKEQEKAKKTAKKTRKTASKKSSVKSKEETEKSEDKPKKRGRKPKTEKSESSEPEKTETVSD